MAGLDPAIQTTPSAVAVSLDRRVKPGEDETGVST
jgi:hypothetical protein